MMRYLINILILLLLVGCKKDTTYTGEVVEEEPFDPVIIKPMPILLNMGDNAGGVEYNNTKGFGGFNQFTSDTPLDTVVWQNSIFHVYSFSKNENADYSVKWSDEQDSANRMCLVDGTINAENPSIGGKPVRLNMSDWSTLDWLDNSFVYYNLHDYKAAYDFFLYYLDDIKSTDNIIHREKDRVYVDVDVDGTRDFMGAKAEVTERQMAIVEKSKYSEELLESCFSTFSANYMINPNFVLKHYLTKIRFEIYPGGNLENKDKSECYGIILDSIYATTKINGKMIVATKDTEACPLGIDFSESRSSRVLLKNKYLDAERNIVDSLSYGKPVYREGDEMFSSPYDRLGVKLDGCFFLAPQESYRFDMRISGLTDRETESGTAGGYTPSGTETMTEKVNLTITPEDGSAMFEAGKAYVVRLAVFGGVEIDVDVDVEPWGKGGEIVIDPDI